MPEFLRAHFVCPFAPVDYELYLDPAYLPAEFIPGRRRSPQPYGTGRGAEKRLARAHTPWDTKVDAHVGSHRDRLRRYV